MKKKKTDDFEKKVKKTIKKYSLIKNKDSVAVACSGGKDSTAALYILNKLGFKPEAITVDAVIGNYTKKNRENLERFCDENKIKLHKISFRDEFGYSLCYIRSLINKKGENLRSCTICGVLRRHLLNKYARKLNFTKLVTGHNKDDEAQSIVMNFFKNNLEIMARLGPITGLTDSKRFVPRIKPLYHVSEKEVEEYSRDMKFPVKYGACPCRTDSYRNQTRIILDKYESKHPSIKDNIIKNFLNIMPILKKEFKKNKTLESCTICGEPSKDKKCMACKIISKIK